MYNITDVGDQPGYRHNVKDGGDKLESDRKEIDLQLYHFIYVSSGKCHENKNNEKTWQS